MKFFKLITSLMTGIGFCLPLIRISFFDDIVSFPFIKAIDGKIMLGIAIFIFILQIIEIVRNSLPIKTLSLIAIVVVSTYFTIFNIYISVIFVKTKLFSYGIGFYMTIIGLLLSLILEFINIISNKEEGYYEVEDTPSTITYPTTPQPMNAYTNNVQANNQQFNQSVANQQQLYHPTNNQQLYQTVSNQQLPPPIVNPANQSITQPNNNPNMVDNNINNQ